MYIHKIRRYSRRIFLIYKASASEEPVNADALKSAIDSIPVSGYYTSDDRYNGKDADTITNSQGSFWAEVQSIADEANRVYTSALNGKANQNAVDEQTDKLNQNDPARAVAGSCQVYPHHPGQRHRAVRNA